MLFRERQIIDFERSRNKANFLPESCLRILSRNVSSIDFSMRNRFAGTRAVKSEMIYGYLRVSTDRQTVENQRFEIHGRGLRVREWIAETVCGSAKIEERELGRVLSKMRSGDVLIATELSRLGRNLLQVMSLLNFCFERGIRVLTVKENYELGSNLTSKVLAFAFSLCAEVERQLISQRTVEALARLKAEGKPLGRPRGSRNKRTKLGGLELFIAEQLAAGVPKSALSRRLGVHRHTLDRAIRRNLLSL